jgi:cytochrome c-type biogenesis protein CcmE
MAHRYIKITVTGLVLASAFSFLMWTTLRDGAEYFKNVDEVMTNRQALEGKTLQLHGYVIPGSTMFEPKTLEHHFKIQSNPIRNGEPGAVVAVTYTGIVPDTFKGEAEVVLKGRLTAEGFHTDPNGVVAKCPSKYEAQSTLPAGSPAGL